jgi:Protein of unknown function (DUF2854)
MLRQISLGNVGLVAGTLLTLMGFIAYAYQSPTLNLIGFVYGVPILLGGLALTASELKPVPMPESSPEVLALRQKEATDTQNQLRKDVTRYRYGQEAHLDEALKRLGLSPTDDDRPILNNIREQDWDGHYALILKFYSPLIPLATWQEKQEKLARFFGPGIRVELVPMADEGEIEVALITAPEAAIAETVSPEAA